ncbi:MAG: OB-fold domain-containing protein [Desulfomonilaceae bacterium]
MTTKTTAETVPITASIVTLPPYDEAPPKLLGGFCAACNRHYFPRPRYCPVCLEAIDEAVLDSDGKVYTFTVVRIKPPLGLPQPYSLAYVDLVETGLRILCLIDPDAIDRLEIGMPVRLAVGPLGHNPQGAPCLRPYFTPRETG